MSKQLVFVIRCPGCKAVCGAYDPVRCHTEDIGEAVKRAAHDGREVAFVESPVLVGEACKCASALLEGA